MTETIPAHGGELVNLLLDGPEAEAAADEAEHRPKLALSVREAADLEMLATGALSPLQGFMVEKDYQAVLDDMRLSSGLVWSLPVTISTDDDGLKRIGRSDTVTLTIDGRAVALLDVEQVYRRDRELEAQAVFGTVDRAHPGVAALDRAGDWVLGGRVRALRLPEHTSFLERRLTPAQTRQAFAERGWRRVVGFQTRNPVHRAHEYIQKCALEVVDGLLLHPLVGETKEDDVPADVRMRCYEILLAGYYPPERVLLSVFPAAMRYAGPKEAIFHALVRKNYGCTHFIVGRDHAGVGNFYGTFDAQLIFDRFDRDDLGITPLFFDHAFWCHRCEGMATGKICPHGDEDRLTLSGTKVREMLRGGERPPPEFSRPEVADVLIEAMAREGDEG
ncbi:MAG TPA: sulfate adenylyltransferase [Actinomycetota bacterium]|nr:sulfate adenylyltransferase [Actinomycetota bacterium]